VIPFPPPITYPPVSHQNPSRLRANLGIAFNLSIIEILELLNLSINLKSTAIFVATKQMFEIDFRDERVFLQYPKTDIV
jgi:hypothetical protein